jgi:hypothetical protein
LGDLCSIWNDCSTKIGDIGTNVPNKKNKLSGSKIKRAVSL